MLKKVWKIINNHKFTAITPTVVVIIWVVARLVSEDILSFGNFIRVLLGGSILGTLVDNFRKNRNNKK